MYDVAVVGAGAAGCVLAARLSEDPACRVLLVEAGPDLLPDSEPKAISDPFPSSYGDPKYAWRTLTAEVGPDRGNGRGHFERGYVQGRVLGGGSSIMGMIAQRGLPGDFDGWRALGADGWGWDDVLPFYKRLEHDVDFDGPLHGSDGPITIRRHKREQWPPFSLAIALAMEKRGYPYLPDLNAAFGDGVSAMPMNNTPTRRVSSANAYLTAEARARPNLDVLAGSEALALVFNGTRVRGVKVQTQQGVHDFESHETIVSCGGIFTPALLLRSGIGAADALQAQGIEVVADLPAVGRNLLNHPGLHVAVHLKQSAVQSRAMRAWGQSMLRYSSGHPDCPPSDMYLFPVNKTSWHPLGQRIGAVSICLNSPFSQGEVTLQSPDPAVMPKVRFGLLKDSRDFDRMVNGLRLALELLSDPLVVPHINEVFHPSGGQANALNMPSIGNWLKSAAINAAFGLAGPVRRALLSNSVIDPAILLADNAALRDAVRERAAGVHHPAGTCRIGTADDKAAVVDPNCRVHGVQGLRIADASVMPTLVRATTHLTALMIGEKVADIVRNDRRERRV